MSPPPRSSRRTLTIGGIAVAGAVVVAGAAYEIPRLLRHRATGEYADLVNRLDDPEQAAIVGRAILSQSTIDAQETALELKKRLAKATLPQLMAADSAESPSLIESGGWVVPKVLADLCVLAAS